MPAPVLIVDDHELVGTSLLMSLRGEGLDAYLVCRGGVDAVLAAAGRLTPGLALLDLDLGRDANGRPVDGIRLVPPLTSAGWTVIILSGSSDHAGIGSALDAGAVAWVSEERAVPGVARGRAGRSGGPSRDGPRPAGAARRSVAAAWHASGPSSTGSWPS